MTTTYERTDGEVLTVLFTHTSEETAYLVDDYPYGFRLRTEIRYWIETTKRGDRFCAQTLNPKTGRWNKPKKSTYSAVMVLALQENGHVCTIGTDFNATAESLAKFTGSIGVENLSDAQRAKLAEVIGYTRAMEHVTFSVRPTSSMTAEEIEKADAEQEKAKRSISKLIYVETLLASEALS